ncbi:MAG: beta-galactosidase, partial [Bryobacteraceae bacterium]
MSAASAVLALLLLAPAAAAPTANTRPAEYLQAVEFPYYLYPRTQWERELVWLKNIGIRTVEFAIPWNWHQLAPGDFDFTGRTSPRRDLNGLIQILRRLGLSAWVRP